MSRADFQLVYDGDALSDHTMDVDELAPALLAVGNLCREANRILNGERADVAVRVRADFERRCFDIHFELIQSLYEQVKTLLGEEHVATAKTLLEWIGILGPTGAIGLFGFLKLRRGRSISNSERLESAVGAPSYRITFEGDRNSIVISEPVYKLANDAKISKTQREIVRPLRKEGISELRFQDEDRVVDIVSKADVDSFYVRPIVEEVGLTSQTVEAILTLRAPVFVPGEKYMEIRD
jgi:hypothetical protein